MDRKYFDALQDVLADLKLSKAHRELDLIADERVPGEEELISLLVEDNQLNELDTQINEVNAMIERDRDRDKERLRMAEYLLESWLAGRTLDYTDYMVTEDVQRVIDIGDAINSGELQLVPIAYTVTPGVKPPPPFVLTQEVIEKTERLEAALASIRAKLAD